MWKIVVGFLLFAGLALFILSKGGDIDMSGEKHGSEATSAGSMFVFYGRHRAVLINYPRESLFR